MKWTDVSDEESNSMSGTLPFELTIQLQPFCHDLSVNVSSDVQGSAQSPEARAAEPHKPDPSRALEWAW